MVYVNQIHLIKKGVRKNRKFFKSMYDCNELRDVKKWFDKLDYSVSLARQADKTMTLDKFLKGINQRTYSILQIASPNPFEIRLSADFTDPEGTLRFGWVICPYTDQNLNLVEKLYEESFGLKLADEPAPKGLLEYYEQRVKSSPGEEY